MTEARCIHGRVTGFGPYCSGECPGAVSTAPTEGGTSEAPSSRRASDRSPMLSTADRDALVERLRGLRSIFGTPDDFTTIDAAAAALEDLTRENERLRYERDDFRRLWARRNDQVAAVRALAPVGFKHPDDEWAQGYNHALTDMEAALDTASAGGRNTDPPARPSLDDGQEDRGDGG